MVPPECENFDREKIDLTRYINSKVIIRNPAIHRAGFLFML